MSFEVGIVGMPNIGKSTLFRAVTSVAAEAANYPFCTIEPNIGIVPVPDQRIAKLEELFSPGKTIPNYLKMVDIAGLVKGASAGEGLGNQFLAHIRGVDAIAHIVRCFEDDNVVHVDGRVDPLADVEVIKTELILSDLQQLDRKIERMERQAKGNKELAAQVDFFRQLSAHLGDGNMARTFMVDENHKQLLQEQNLITAKPYFYVLNVAEEELGSSTPLQDKILELAKSEEVDAVRISCKIEAELAEMEPEEKLEFLNDLGIASSGLDQVIQEGFRLLNIITFFTAGKQEVRAWNVHAGSHAPQAAGKIHSDMERGFIRAEVYHFDDVARLGSEQAVKEAGKLRIEGKEYVVKDGDIMHFRFNV